MAESAFPQQARDSLTSSGNELPPYLQCVPYAREQSGIAIYGDAHTWWDKAEGKFKRGSRPKVGAVMAFQPHRNMQLGHVAAVSKIIDNRTVLLRHANWSPINGRRGQIENDVKAIDVSPNNDWSAVRVWYHPIQALGKTAWPIHGFIYSDKAPKFDKPAFAKPRIAAAPARKVVKPSKPSVSFSNAFADFDKKSAVAGKRKTIARPITRPVAQAAPRRVAVRQQPRTSDPVTKALSLYD